MSVTWQFRTAGLSLLICLIVGRSIETNARSAEDADLQYAVNLMTANEIDVDPASAGRVHAVVDARSGGILSRDPGVRS